MIHKKIEEFPYGMTVEEANLIMNYEDIYNILETFDTLEDSLDFIKDTYGVSAYQYAKEDAELNIKQEMEFIKYTGDKNKLTYASFDISDNVKNYRKGKNYEASFFWFSTGKVIRAELY